MYQILFTIVLLLLGLGFGQWAERRHYRSIIRREYSYRHILLIASKRLPEPQPVVETSLVAGNVVVSVDYFKRFVSGLRNLIGGRMSSYETLIDRARREAILRMKEQAHKKRANMVFNVKLETASISKGRGDSIGAVEVLAYGTALIPVAD